MTKRELYTEVIKNEAVSVEVREGFEALLAKMDEANAKRTSADSKSSKESLAKRNAIFNALTNEPMTAEQIAEAVGTIVVDEKEIVITKGMIPANLRSAVAAGDVVKGKIKNGKSEVTTYALFSVE